MSRLSPRTLAVRMANGDELTVTAVGNDTSLCFYSDLRKGDWVRVRAEGHDPCGLWLNTAQIVSIEEVDE